MRVVVGMAARIALVCLFCAFAWANFAQWRTTGHPSGLGTTLLEGWVAAMFVFRRSNGVVSTRRLAWIAAPLGTFAMVFARPSGGGIPNSASELIQLAGVGFALVSLCTLGRSFGLVAANRGVKTRGPYGLVRHPAYTGYLISYCAYIAENPSPRNIALLAVSSVFQLLRISEEELVLAGDAAYNAYRRRVRYRLIPLLY